MLPAILISRELERKTGRKPRRSSPKRKTHSDKVLFLYARIGKEEREGEEGRRRRRGRGRRGRRRRRGKRGRRGRRGRRRRRGRGRGRGRGRAHNLFVYKIQLTSVKTNRSTEGLFKRFIEDGKAAATVNQVLRRER